jgi:hypothetical protein
MKRATLLAMAVVTTFVGLAGCREEELVTPPPAGGPAAHMSTSTAASDGIILVGQYEYGGAVSLVGTWSRGAGWVNPEFVSEDGYRYDESIFRTLLPGGGNWTLYHLGCAPVTVRSEAPELRPARGGDRWYSASIADPPEALAQPSYARWLAVCGGDTVDRGPIELLSKSDDAVTQAARDQVRQAVGRRRTELLSSKSDDPYTQAMQDQVRQTTGVDAECYLDENIRVDLDGDGRLERIVTLGGGHIVGVFQTHVGDLQTAILLSKPLYYGDEFNPGVGIGARVFAIADINGDGSREIACVFGVADGSGISIYTFDGKEFRCVLRHLHVVA